MGYNTIKLKKYSDVIEEFEANAALTPGMLVEMMSTGKLRKHATAGGNVLPPMFALEDALQGKEIHDDYAAADKVQVWLPYRGDQVYAILADGEHVHVGDALESNGAGFLRAHTADPGDSTTGTVQNAIVAVALENKDLSGESSAVESEGTLATNQRIKVRIV